MRRPNWTRDEHILALDLFIRANKIQLDDSDPQVIELSQFLRSLPNNVELAAVDPTFRNANGVSMKLGNLRASEPGAKRGGLSSNSKGEGEVWLEFSDRWDDLRAEASRIRSQPQQVSSMPLIDLDFSAHEGGQKLRTHLARERNPMIVSRKKAQVLAQRGALKCEACGFDFSERYGKHGESFIECHHTMPLSSRAESQATSLSDLVLLCSNCHRMVHRKKLPLTLVELRSILRLLVLSGACKTLFDHCAQQ